MNPATQLCGRPQLTQQHPTPFGDSHDPVAQARTTHALPAVPRRRGVRWPGRSQSAAPGLTRHSSPVGSRRQRPRSTLCSPRERCGGEGGGRLTLRGGATLRLARVLDHSVRRALLQVARSPSRLFLSQFFQSEAGGSGSLLKEYLHNIHNLVNPSVVISLIV